MDDFDDSKAVDETVGQGDNFVTDKLLHDVAKANHEKKEAIKEAVESLKKKYGDYVMADDSDQVSQNRYIKKVPTLVVVMVAMIRGRMYETRGKGKS